MLNLIISTAIYLFYIFVLIMVYTSSPHDVKDKICDLKPEWRVNFLVEDNLINVRKETDLGVEFRYIPLNECFKDEREEIQQQGFYGYFIYLIAYYTNLFRLKL